MIVHRTLRWFWIAILATPALAQQLTPKEALDRYLTSDPGACESGNRSMEIDIQASLPKLKKQGTMHGLKVISSSGQVAYRFLRFTGDKLVKTDVIARFLNAESQPQEHLSDIGNTETNYKFHFKRLEASGNGTLAYVYELKPRKKRVGLFKGELWLDANSGAQTREAGEFVKSPSIFIQKVRFVRDYAAAKSCSVPARTSITVQTRIAGAAEMLVVQHPVDQSWRPPDAGESND